MRITTTLILLTLVCAGTILLQIFLSKRESRLPGLVLPAISFLFGLLYPLSMMAPSEGITAGFVVSMLLVWLLGNIPTIVLLTIYYSCRQKQRHKQQLNRMNIQDLD